MADGGVSQCPCRQEVSSEKKTERGCLRSGTMIKGKLPFQCPSQTPLSPGPNLAHPVMGTCHAQPRLSQDKPDKPAIQ